MGAQAPELAQGYAPELALASRQLLQLAEATPADKFGWRPTAGVRGVVCTVRKLPTVARLPTFKQGVEVFGWPGD